MRNATLASAALPRRVHNALERLYALLSVELEHQLERMLVDFEQQLFRQAEQTRNTGLQALHFETLRKVREHRAELIPAFLKELESTLARLRDPAVSTATPHPRVGQDVQIDFSRLRLLDDAEMSEDSLVRSIGARHEARAGLPLMLLGQRFGVLAGAPAFDAERLPVGPHALARLLVEASRTLPVDQDTRLMLLRSFDQHVMAGYAQTVEALNILLARENILPSLSYVPLRTRPTAQPRSAGVGAGDAASGDGGRGAAKSAASAGVRPHTAWLGEADTGAGDDDDIAFSLLQQLLAGRRDLLGKLRAEPQPKQQRSPLPTAEVVAALESQQADRSRTQRSQRTVTDIRQTLLAQSRQQHGQATRLSSEDSDTFELLGLLYAEMVRDLREGASSRALVERLQVPVLRVALQDPAFFVRSQHPARQLLNAVAEAGAKWLAEDETDPQLESQLHQAVDHVVQHYHGDPAVFATANQSLQEHLQMLARKAEVAERRHVEAVRGKEKLEVAKRRAVEVIEQAMRDQPLPKFVRALLQQAWSDVLTLTLLRHGGDSAEWKQHAGATAQIVAASAGTATAPPELAARIEHALTLVGYHADEASAIARRLTTGHDDGEDDPASRTELAMKLKARTRLGAGSDPSKPKLPARTPREQACYEHLRTLPFGTWIEFATGPKGEVVRRRLAWFSLVTDHALFVNQRGQRVDEQSLDSVARQLAQQQASVVTAERGRLVDRAWQAALNALRSFTGRNDQARETTP